MKCESIQNDLLREQTGELSRFRRQQVLRHLQKCEACRRFHEETALLMKLGETPEPGRQARPDTMARIMEAARAEKSRGDIISIRPASKPVPAWRRPVMAWAALLVVLAAGAWLLLRPGTRALDTPLLAQQKPTPASVQTTPEASPIDISWDSPIGSELAELDTALAMASAESTFTPPPPANGVNSDPDAMIQELLELEGVEI